MINIECVSEFVYILAICFRYWKFNEKRQTKLSNSGKMKRHHFQCDSLTFHWKFWKLRKNNFYFNFFYFIFISVFLLALKF